MRLQTQQIAHRLYLTASFVAAGDPARQADQAYGRLAAELGRCGATVVQERLFGALAARDAALAARDRCYAAAGIADTPPCTYIEGSALDGEGLAGVQILAVCPAALPACTVRDFSFRGQTCGRLVEAEAAQALYLSDVGGRVPPPRPGAGRPDDARHAFDAAASALAAAGMSFTDVVRTWIYLDDIVAWYDEFNAVRNRFFREQGLSDDRPTRALPASTGIGGRNPTGTACAMDLVAVRSPGEDRTGWRALSNPLQSEAYDYGSAFSRGLCVPDGAALAIYVSGTASIDQEGSTVHLGSLAGQIERTLLNVQALLQQAGASFEDVCHSTVFFKPGTNPSGLPRVRDQLGLPDFPAVVTRADICREDLLFEIDAEAAIPRDDLA